MGAVVQESYGYKQMAGSGAVLGSRGGSIGGFLCTTAGTLKLTLNDSAGATVVDTISVVAGTFLPLPFAFPPGTGLYATLTGAAGTFAVNN